MNKIYLISLVSVFTFLLCQTANAQKLFGIGIQAGAGANYATINETQSAGGTGSFQDVGTKFAPNFGLFLDINPPIIDNLIIHTSAGFRQRGFLAKQPALNVSGAASIADYAVNNSYLYVDGVLRSKMNLKGPLSGFYKDQG